MTSKKNKLLVISGPTAVGKTDLCINLAKKFNTSIVSADSRQFYREMNIGTAKPSATELQEIPHHFINSLSIHEDYDVRKFEEHALQTIDRLFLQQNPIIMTGGSGLYIDALTNGLDDIPQVDADIRKEVIETYNQQGIGELQALLKNLDPIYYGQVDLHNPQRLIRALEVCIGTGKPFSSFRVKRKASRPFEVIKIALERNREELYSRINQRMDQMIAEGLFEEASLLFPYRNLNALQTVGYKEIFDYMDGNYDREEAIRLLKRNSRRYAKRQMTWLKKDSEYTWFHPSELDRITKFITDQMSS
ncbi:tRNA (adenosine(37)-N6)-dimethylallyltransferase MiaA [Lunatibacter salilacus]|uniref:tRNA (adenosine(37)-N6)-dimethylallyltransferase MiaA n=1 Tax=Lunatibacter salilacus TaxID=2483804 RepID=UPI00374471C6